MLDRIIRGQQPSDYGSGAVDAGLEPETRALLMCFIRSAVAARAGEGLLDALVRCLWAELDAQLVFIGERTAEDEGRIRVRVAFHDGVRGPVFEYDLAGTPCEGVVEPHNMCLYAHDVATMFPEDTALAEMGAEGYVGLPLFDTNGDFIGIMAAVTTKPIVDPTSVAQVMRIFARRTALELEYLRAVENGDRDVADVTRRMAAEDDDLASVIGLLSSSGIVCA